MNVTIASIVKNEEGKFLKPALECWSVLADRIVVVDNGSTDGTPDILHEFGCEVHRFEPCMNGNEAEARAFLWEKAICDADWLVHADADHCFAGDFRTYLTGRRVVFPVFDLWNRTEYRSDAWWQVRPWWQAVKVSDVTSIKWIWPDRGWHSGHVPVNANILGPATPIPEECGLLHYGYATPELRERHFDAYMSRRAYLTPTEIYHARTILDPWPNLVALPFKPRWALF